MWLIQADFVISAFSLKLETRSTTHKNRLDALVSLVKKSYHPVNQTVVINKKPIFS